MQQHLFHRCGQRIDVAEAFEGRKVRHVFLDHQTGDGLERCPRCEKALYRSSFRCQAPRVSREKLTRPSPAAQEASRLIAQARRIAARRSAA